MDSSRVDAGREAEPADWLAAALERKLGMEVRRESKSESEKLRK